MSGLGETQCAEDYYRYQETSATISPISRTETMTSSDSRRTENMVLMSNGGTGLQDVEALRQALQNTSLSRSTIERHNVKDILEFYSLTQDEHGSLQGTDANILQAVLASFIHKDYQFQQILFKDASLLSKSFSVADKFEYSTFSTPWHGKAFPLHLAVACGDRYGVQYLLKIGADLHQRAENDATALHIAAFNNRTAIARDLIDAGIDINARRTKCGSAMHWACFEGLPDLLDLLISKGADINIQESADSTKTPLSFAAQEGQIDAIKTLIKHGVIINGPRSNSFTALHSACLSGHADVIKLLHAGGADLNARTDMQETPLYLASECGHVEIIKLLLDLGSDLHARDKENETALHGAARKGHVKAIEYLLSQGANLEAKDMRGFTPMYWSASNGHGDAVVFMLEQGATVEIADKDGISMIKSAEMQGYPLIAQLLAVPRPQMKTKQRFSFLKRGS